MAKLISSSPIRYTSRTFNTIMNDINADPELLDKPDWFKRQVAGVGDMLSMINNAAVNNAYLRTAFTRQAVMDLCALIGYEIPDATTCSGTMLFYFDADSVQFPKIVTRPNVVGILNNRRYESVEDVTVNAPETVSVDNGQSASSVMTIARDCFTGEKVRLTGILPSGLNEDQDYYVIRVDGTHVKLAKNASDAVRGIPVDFTPDTVTPGFVDFTFYSFRVTCYQQEFKEDVQIGESDGISEWQEFDLPDAGVLKPTCTVSVNGETWPIQENLVFSHALDKHCQYVQLLNRRAYIRFGNNEFGAIPEGAPILATYCAGGGQESNVAGIGQIKTYAGSDGDVMGCFNATPFTGGADPQSIELAKRIAPGLLRSRDRFVIPEDGEALAISYGNVAMAKCFPNFYTILSAKIITVAKGGGNPDAAHKLDIQNYLIDRSILQSIDVRVVDANIMKRDVIAQCVVLPSHDQTFVRNMFRIGLQIFLSETSQEILDGYLSGGTDEAIRIIRLNFGETITSDMYDIITEFMENLLRLGARSFGETIQESILVAFLQGNIDGISYMNISSPTFPLYHLPDEISSVGSIYLS